MTTWTRSHWLLLAVFSTVITLEYSTPPPYVFGYLYIGAVLLASKKLSQKAVFWVTGTAVGLTLLNLWIPGTESISFVTVVNRIITILALIITAWLSDRLREYETAIIRQKIQITNQNQLTKVREDFISTLTHDLKTPLLGAIETLKAWEAEQFGRITQAQKRVIAIMNRSHQMMIQLVETLMDIYHNDMEGLQLNQQPVDLLEIAEEVMLQLASLAASRQINLYLKQGDSDFRQTYRVYGDTFQLQRVFSNLITNGINHSLKGGKVEVLIHIKSNEYQVEIFDQGQGIDPHELPHLFERFYQGYSNRQAKGTGLGLYLSRQIIAAHGGKIWAEPRSPQGAMFAFSLPRLP
ncbi:sensor histidine kinase [Gloeomargarita lithophora]